MTVPVMREVAVTFRCEGDMLIGVLAVPTGSKPRTGVLVVVGGPQYRVGSHRQFLHLSRTLAAGGVACMRFDVRGMGDSSGDMRSFMDIDADIRAAVDAFTRNVPSVARIVLWGLCDGASAACFYAPTDARIAGLVLANPWVRTDASRAETYLRHYYWRRLGQPEFWKKLVSGQLRLEESTRSFVALLKAARAGAASGETRERAAAPGFRALPFPGSMCAALAAFRNDVLIILSGNDYTAAEFRDVVGETTDWSRALQREGVTWRDMKSSDHTFSTEAWRGEVAALTSAWLDSLSA